MYQHSEGCTDPIFKLKDSDLHRGRMFDNRAVRSTAAPKKKQQEDGKNWVMKSSAHSMIH